MITMRARNFGKSSQQVHTHRATKKKHNEHHYHADVTGENTDHPVLLKILPDLLVFAHMHISHVDLSSALQYKYNEHTKIFCPQSNKCIQVYGLAHHELGVG